MQHYENKLDDTKLHWVEHGKITDKIFADKFQIYGDKLVDDKAMKSQRVVHITHPAVVADTLNVMQKKIDSKNAIIARAKAKERKKTRKQVQFDWRQTTRRRTSQTKDRRSL